MLVRTAELPGKSTAKLPCGLEMNISQRFLIDGVQQYDQGRFNWMIHFVTFCSCLYDKCSTAPSLFQVTVSKIDIAGKGKEYVKLNDCYYPQTNFFTLRSNYNNRKPTLNISSNCILLTSRFRPSKFEAQFSPGTGLPTVILHLNVPFSTPLAICAQAAAGCRAGDLFLGARAPHDNLITNWVTVFEVCVTPPRIR